MHPIERLRYVARASAAPQAAMVQETAAALAAFAEDPPGLVVACRRIVARQPTSGPLVWLCARALAAGDPGPEVWAAAGEAAADRTAIELARALPPDAVVAVLGWPEVAGDGLARRADLHLRVVDPDRTATVAAEVDPDADVEVVPLSGLGAATADVDIVVLEALALGPTGALAPAGARAAAAVARHAGVAVWLVAGVGRALPARMWDALRDRSVVDPSWELGHEVVPLDLIDQVAGPTGVALPAEAVAASDCPVVPELFRGLV